jgi:hypothetical protein
LIQIKLNNDPSTPTVTSGAFQLAQPTSYNQAYHPHIKQEIKAQYEAITDIAAQIKAKPWSTSHIYLINGTAVQNPTRWKSHEASSEPEEFPEF